VALVDVFGSESRRESENHNCAPEQAEFTCHASRAELVGESAEGVQQFFTSKSWAGGIIGGFVAHSMEASAVVINEYRRAVGLAVCEGFLASDVMSSRLSIAAAGIPFASPVKKTADGRRL
jgi:hypothetical protein